MKKLFLSILFLFAIINVKAQCAPIPYSGNSATLTCINPSVSIPLATTISPVSCVWANTPGLVGGGNTLNPMVINPGSYSFTLTNTING